MGLTARTPPCCASTGCASSPTSASAPKAKACRSRCPPRRRTARHAAAATGLACRARHRRRLRPAARVSANPSSNIKGLPSAADMAAARNRPRRHPARRLPQRPGLPYSKEASIAKLIATDNAMRVTTDAVQVRRLRLSRDFPVERYMREAKVMQIFEGTNQIQRLVIGRHLARDAGTRSRSSANLLGKRRVGRWWTAPHPFTLVFAPRTRRGTPGNAATH